jgi:hypothetical protein
MYRHSTIHLIFILMAPLFCWPTASAKNTQGNDNPDDENLLSNHVYNDNIHTVQLYREGWEFSQPVLILGSGQHLVLKFDDLSGEAHTYSYTIKHCTTDWTPSNLIESEYLDGFFENSIDDYEYSVNTTIPYVNYLLRIPNDDVKLKLSGNYVLTVWRDYSHTKPLLSRRFFVVGQKVSVTGRVKAATYDSYKGPNQEVDFEIQHPDFSIQNPRNEVKVLLMQNGRWDNAKTDLLPQFIRENSLTYDYSGENVFPGGNEFRNFDMKSLRVNGKGIAGIQYLSPLYHVTLYADKDRHGQDYHFENDLNGHYLVKRDNVTDSNVESDYAMVHFSLDIQAPLTEGNIYVFGELSDWQCSPSNQMVYSIERKQYELALLLKQGFYDYEYAYVRNDDGKINTSLLEGSHVETENNYQIFVYYRGISSRYDQLIGYQVINSANE